jgi:hypothetical protein
MIKSVVQPTISQPTEAMASLSDYQGQFGFCVEATLALSHETTSSPLDDASIETVSNLMPYLLMGASQSP